MPDRVTISAAAHRGIIEHARLCVPNECCGVLLGAGDRIASAEPVANERPTPHRFAAAAADVARIERAAAADGWALLGYYHSHPSSEPRPSGIDRRLLVWPDLPPFIHIIVSLVTDPPRLAAYNTRNNRWARLALIVG